MTWGSWGANFTTDEMAQRIRECHALGLLSFDHADIYGGYSTEEAFGKGFQKNSTIHRIPTGFDLLNKQ